MSFLNGYAKRLDREHELPVEPSPEGGPMLLGNEYSL